MSLQRFSLCLLVVAAVTAADQTEQPPPPDNAGDFGFKVAYSDIALNQTNAVMQDRSMATDHVLRALHPDGLDMMAELDDQLQRRLEDANIADACPAGPKGLLCRRRFALRGADECAGGRCVMCRRCDLLTPESWPICCKNHFLCCRPIARACQTCQVAQLVPFCQDKFGRCHPEQ